jgi:hypothetical protein
MVSADEYERLKRRDREVLTLADLTDEEVAEIMKARVPAKYKHLDKELKGWKP